MKSLTAAQQRFFDNAVLFAALQLIFDSLEKFGVPMYPLGEVANTTSGGTPYRGISDYYGGNIPWIKSGELRDGLIKESEEYITDAGLQNSSAKVFPKGTLVVALYGATVGKTGILAINTASNQAVCAITPNNRVSTFFLFWFLRYKRPEFLKGSFGAAQPNISQKVLRETLIPIPTTDLQKEICNFLEIVEERQKGKKDFLLPNLPSPLSNLRDIVARIEELTARIEEARGLKKGIMIDARKILLGKYGEIVKGAKELPMAEVAPLIRRSVQVEPSEEYYELGIRSFGKGTFHKPALTGASLGTKRIFRIEAGDLLFNNVFAWEGAVAVAKQEDHGRVGSHRFLTCVPKKDIAISSFLCFHFLTERGLQQLGEASPGSAGRNRTLGIKALEETKIPAPAIEKQIWFDRLQGKLNLVSHIQSETSAELNALLPSILDKAFKGEL